MDGLRRGFMISMVGFALMTGLPTTALAQGGARTGIFGSFEHANIWEDEGRLGAGRGWGGGLERRVTDKTGIDVEISRVHHVRDFEFYAVPASPTSPFLPYPYRVQWEGDATFVVGAVSHSLVDAATLTRALTAVELQPGVRHVSDTYAWDLTRGRTDPDDIDPHWRATDRPVDLHSTLDQAARENRVEETLRGLAPKSPQYIGLKHQLARYREIERSGGWPVVPEAPTLRLGSHHAAVAVLRERLSKSGDVTLTPTSQDS